MDPVRGLQEEQLLLQQSTHRQQWSKVDNIIDHWLLERHDLLILYTELCQIINHKNEQAKIDALNHFCQILIDYVSAGHFEIFEKIAEAESQSFDTTIELDKNLVVNILRTTNDALDFNDKYSQPCKLTELKDDLSKLGERIAQRLEWEDKLIQDYFKITNSVS